MNICSIIAKNYAAHARVLAESFLRTHPDGSCAVLVVDDYAGYLDPAEEPFELIGLEEIGLPDPEAMAAAYDVTELSTAVKPWLLRHLLAREGVEAVTYLDPDIWVADSIAEVDALARRHGVVLIPHFTAPLPRDGFRPAEEDILIAGAYNLGFISLGAGETADQLLDWWSERLERHCVIDPGAGLFVDQRWIDLVPGIWEGVHVLRDPGCNLAYWNLPTRTLAGGGDAFTVDGEPLRFFHFSGFDPRRPGVLSKHQNRIDVGSSEPLADACRGYARRLLEAGYEEAGSWPYGWETLPNGVRLDRAVRSLYREAEEQGRLGGSVFERRGAKRFLSYLNEVPRDGRVSRYARAVRDSRADLRAAFPDVDGRDAAAFNGWLLENADPLRISPQLLPEAVVAAAEEPSGGAGRERLGVNLAGYLSSELGVGEAARQIRAALDAAGLPTAPIDVPVEEERLPEALGGLAPDQHPFDVNVLCVNADMLPAVARAAGPGFFEHRHSAGLWFWEVERFPERWRGSFDHLDEVWTASEFVAEALRPLAPVPVRTIRVPVIPGEPGVADRASLSMPDGFCFLFVFDYRSVFRRKNPLGVVEAFSRAFEPGSGASLLIKSVCADGYPEQAAELAAAAAGHPDVHLLDCVVSAAAKNAIIASCDCYVSLHRSEGLGLTMAEAMYFGKPVIATGYSGNLDFMTEENSYLVDYSLEEIGAGAEPYPAAARWAEPSVEQAAERMRAVFENRPEAARKGARAAADIRATHSLEAAGRVLESHLAEVRRDKVIGRLEVPSRALVAPPAAASAGVPAALQADHTSGRTRLQHLLEFEQAPPRKDAGRLRHWVKRLYLRALRPYTSYQRRIDLSIRDVVLELGAEVGALERRLASAEEDRAAGLREEVAASEARGREGLSDLESRQREEISSLEARLREQLAAVDARLGSLAAETKDELARDRTFVDALRASHDRLAAGTESTLGALREEVEGAGIVARAGAVKPYMADERFAPHADPALGTVIGFNGDSRNGGPGGYRGFEELFRGPEEMIRERQARYLPLVADHAPVLDAGCGRGEFLDLLRDAGVEARGVDLDAGMVERCREKGHDVERGDLLEALEEAAPGSLGCVFSAQVIEHLEAEDLERLLALSLERLRPGGRLIVETVNPHCAEALKAFWVDPTHRRPLFPETVLALCQLAGFHAADAFCPLGQGDWETDRLTSGEYAVVATVAGG